MWLCVNFIAECSSHQVGFDAGFIQYEGDVTSALNCVSASQTLEPVGNTYKLVFRYTEKNLSPATHIDGWPALDRALTGCRGFHGELAWQQPLSWSLYFPDKGRH